MRCRGAGFLPWQEGGAAGAVPAAALDPPVRALVAALNRTSWARTVFSCGGHPEEPDSVQRGRRQAHVDVAVCDLVRWRRFVAQCRRDIPAAVGHLRPPEVPGAGVRCVEGSLGAIPPWLAEALATEHELWMGDRQLPQAAAPWWRRLLLVRRPQSRAPAWRYRRLALEPVPYTMPPGPCRRALDAALAAAVGALRLE